MPSRMRGALLAAAAMSGLALGPATPAATTSAGDCEAYRAGPVITTPLEVGRCRATGIREPRVIKIAYPPAYVPAPFRVTGPAGIATRRDALFEVVIDTGAPLGPGDGPRDDLRLYISAVGRYPLSSSIGRIGGRPGHIKELLTAPNGTGYHAWDGYRRTGHDLSASFVGVAYPGAGSQATDIDLWAFLNATSESTDAPQCNVVDRYPAISNCLSEGSSGR